MNIENHNFNWDFNHLKWPVFLTIILCEQEEKGFVFSSPITTFKLHGNECIQGDYISFYYQLIV